MRPSIFKLAADWRLLAGLAGLAAVLLAAALPLGSALEFGADEGMELSKALLYAEHPALVARLWSDQPALYAKLLGAAFKLFSPSILVARLVAAAFGALITISIWGIVSELDDKTAGVWAAVFFLLSPRVLILLVSTMIELPAFALALASFWTTLVARRKGSSWWLAGSALLLGCALNIKLTPVVMLPALCLHWLLFEAAPLAGGSSGGAGKSGAAWFRGLKPLVVWLAVSGAVWLLLLCLIPPGANRDFLWGSHAKAGPALMARNAAVYGFSPGEYFAAHAEGTLGTIIGCSLLIYLRRWRALVFPASFVLAALVVHAFHRPWWWYYWLHFAIPMSMLAGMGLRALGGLVVKAAPQTWRAGGRTLVWRVALAGLAAATVVQGLPRFAAGYSELRKSPSIRSSALLAEILKYKDRARWLYSLDAKYSFFSQIPSPPELAVLPLKRFYSGGITFDQILALLREYKVEEILLTSEPDPDGRWSRFLAADYVEVFKGNGCTLHVAKAILP